MLAASYSLSRHETTDIVQVLELLYSHVLSNKQQCTVCRANIMEKASKQHGHPQTFRTRKTSTQR